MGGNATKASHSSRLSPERNVGNAHYARHAWNAMSCNYHNSCTLQVNQKSRYFEVIMFISLILYMYVV